MAYLKPQTPLKDLNSGDYFYPLTTIDQIITGNNRLSAFMSEDSSNHNLLNLKNIGNITGNIILNGTLTVSDNTFIPAHLAVGGYNNTSYSLSTASFICDSWIRTVGSSGWYNESYGGGWYMSDNTWIRTYGSKSIYQNAGKIRTDGEMWSKYIRIVDNWIGVYENIDNTTKRFGYMQIDRSNNGWFRFTKEQGGGFLFTGGSVRCDSGFRVEGNNQGYYAKSSGFPTGTPSSTIWFEPFNWYNTADQRIGTVGSGFQTDGWTFTHIQHQRLIGSTRHYTSFFMMINGSGSRKLTCSAPLYGAVWNDYAEFRKGQMNNLKPGQVVTEIGNGEMKLANKKLQKGCKILSDTFGFAIGETKECKLPIAVSGRVLVYCDTPKEELEPGDCLCANYNGNAIKMTQEEIINYPDRIIGTVSEIPNYEIWHGGEYRPEIKNNPEDIQVDGRIWVYVR